jgi:hypothetical protein
MKKVVRIFNSFEEEETAERERRAAMTMVERLEEFAVIQTRIWGKSWTDTPISKKVVWEDLPWCEQKK